MQDEAMVVAIVAIGCGTGLCALIINTIRAAIVRAPQRGQGELVDELRSLRAEVNQLRQQNNDVLLSLDTAVDRMDRRLTHVETRGQLGGPQAGEEPALVRPAR
jgi:hypothetical protein